MHNSLEARVPFLDTFFYNILNFNQKNVENYNGKKILKDIYSKNFKKKIKKKIAFQNYLSKQRKLVLIDYAEKKINNKFKIFEFICYLEFSNILKKIKLSNELILE